MNGTARTPKIQTSEIRTKFRSVFQTERSDFGHLLYKSETKNREKEIKRERENKEEERKTKE